MLVPRNKNFRIISVTFYIIKRYFRKIKREISFVIDHQCNVECYIFDKDERKSIIKECQYSLFNRNKDKTSTSLTPSLLH